MGFRFFAQLVGEFLNRLKQTQRDCDGSAKKIGNDPKSVEEFGENCRSGLSVNVF